MKKKIKHKKIKKGSSLVIIMVLLFILTMMGIIAISLSLSNVNMASKVKISSKEYYDLDRLTEEIISNIDSNLKTCEDSALGYMKEEKYNSDKPVNDLKYGYNQGFFYARWKKEVYEPSLIDTFDIQGNPKKIVDSEKYADKTDKFFQGAFSRVYYNYITKNFTDLDQKVRRGVNPDTSAGIEYKVTVVMNNDKNYGEVSASSEWEQYEPEEDDIQVKINAKNIKGKTLNTLVKMKAPIYQAVIQNKDIAIQGNPIWTNAITAFGSVNFNNCNVDIYGDVFSANNKGEKSGISINNSRVNSYGNIYSNGDFHAVSGTSNVKVNKYTSDVKRDLKKAIYENEVFFKKNNENIFPQNLHVDTFIEGSVPASKKTIYFLNKDYNGGNVYCNNLSIENNAKNTEIFIDSNVWTKDDVINNSQGDSTIKIKGNYIGITPFKEGVEEGSCIVNNIYNLDNEIILGGNLIVPGRKILTDLNGKKYQTVESISGNTWTTSDFLTPYISERMTSWPTWGEKYLFDIGNINNSFNLIPQDKQYYYKKFIDAMERTSKSKDTLPEVVSGVICEAPEVEGFVSGAAILNVNNDYRCYGADNNYKINYNVEADVFSDKNIVKNFYYNMNALESLLEKSTLENVFNSKTKYLGLFNINIDSMVNNKAILDDKDNPINESESKIIYLRGNNNIDVSGCEGIIYCDGNLNISGSGIYKGTIVCTGNVTISGNVKLHYDEDVLINILKDKNNKYVKSFFRPGQTGETLFVDSLKMNNVRARKVISKERYKVTEWKQGREK